MVISHICTYVYTRIAVRLKCMCVRLSRAQGPVSGLDQLNGSFLEKMIQHEKGLRSPLLKFPSLHIRIELPCRSHYATATFYDGSVRLYDK